MSRSAKKEEKLMQKLELKVWRGKRPHLSVRVHPDLMTALRRVARRERLSLSQCTYEMLYRGMVDAGVLEE